MAEDKLQSMHFSGYNALALAAVITGLLIWLHAPPFALIFSIFVLAFLTIGALTKYDISKDISIQAVIAINFFLMAAALLAAAQASLWLKAMFDLLIVGIIVYDLLVIYGIWATTDPLLRKTTLTTLILIISGIMILALLNAYKNPEETLLGLAMFELIIATTKSEGVQKLFTGEIKIR